jgi:hypothetical protein
MRCWDVLRGIGSRWQSLAVRQSVAECSLTAVKAGLWSANEFDYAGLAKMAEVTS